jgi:hypothetical protein
MSYSNHDDDSSTIFSSEDSSVEDIPVNECWIEWFINKKGNEFFAEVDTAFVQKEYNTIELNIPNFERAISVILDVEGILGLL